MSPVRRTTAVTLASVPLAFMFALNAGAASADDTSGPSQVSAYQLQGGDPSQLAGDTTITVPNNPVEGPAYITDGSGAAVPFDRDASASWGLTHAQDLQDPLFSGCAWFVSRALWAGGLAQTSSWNAHPFQGATHIMPGSPTARSVDDLLNYLIQAYPASTFTGLDFGPDSITNAQVGDVVAYDWDGNGTYDHLALVTSLEPSGYPDVSEWGVGSFPSDSTSYTSRGWTWSKNTGQWLQSEYGPQVSAALLHIDTTIPLTY